MLNAKLENPKEDTKRYVVTQELVILRFIEHWMIYIWKSFVGFSNLNPQGPPTGPQS